ncbi:MAG: hypothetical protein M1818_004458 [Claussenomyces sp. TS43310]|nr:MAG: hypothetical protein M1818_004458 [Claussenomyces sp. TS43310]
MATTNPTKRSSGSPNGTAKSPREATSPGQAQADADAVAFQAENTIEVGTDSGDSDTGYHTDTGSAASTSISSSVRDFTFENGRRYHRFREGTYAMPNDEAEQDREDMKHAMSVNLCGGRLHLAPLDNPQNIIDLGTGTGIWAIDMGDDYPSASILGIDLSPIQPAWVPPNVRFMVDDAESPWLHPANHFDFVHARFCAQAFKDFPRLLSRAYEHLKPGGWVEFQDMVHLAHCDDGSLDEERYCHMLKWLALLDEGLQRFGVHLNGCCQHEQRMINAGFINVEQRIFKVPIGQWPKNRTLKLIGLYLRTVLIEGLQGISLGAFTRGLGWTREEVELMLVDVRKALLDSSQHTYFTFYAVYGQKPMT